MNPDLSLTLLFNLDEDINKILLEDPDLGKLPRGDLLSILRGIRRERAEVSKISRGSCDSSKYFFQKKMIFFSDFPDKYQIRFPCSGRKGKRNGKGKHGSRRKG